MIRFNRSQTEAIANTSTNTYLGWTEREPSIKHCESNICFLTHFFLKEFGNILHHTLEPCWLFEFCSCLVLVLWIHKLDNHALVLTMERLGVRIHFDYNIVGISWEWRVTSFRIRHITLTVTLCPKQGVKLVVLNINHQALVGV